MDENLWKQIEIEFLDMLYKQKGAIEVNMLQHIFKVTYEIEQHLFNMILNKAVENEYCIIEKINNLNGTEEDIVFLKSAGLERLAKKRKLSTKKILKNKMTYELKCDGYSSFSEWLENNRELLSVEEETTKMFARALGDMEMILTTYKDNQKEIREIIQEVIDRNKSRTERIDGYNNTIYYAVVMAIYEKLMELIGTNDMIPAVENAKRLIESIMPSRHAATIKFI